MGVQVAAKSDTGCHREKNEDAFFVDSKNGLYIICDGMGGHPAGEVASQQAIEYVVAFLEKARVHRTLPRKDQTDFEVVWGKLIVEAVECCCDEMVRFNETHPERSGMATTITVVQIVEGVAFVGHLGDSRLYLRHAGVAKQLTNDHTLLQEFTQANPNWINSNCDPDALLRFKNILTRCVGRERNFEVDSLSFPLAIGDVLLLCTDGLSNYLASEKAIVPFLEDSNLHSVVDSLVDFANSQGGRDNITVVAIKITKKNRWRCD